jgi:hypothetical protein
MCLRYDFIVYVCLCLSFLLSRTLFCSAEHGDEHYHMTVDSMDTTTVTLRSNRFQQVVHNKFRNVEMTDMLSLANHAVEADAQLLIQSYCTSRSADTMDYCIAQLQSIVQNFLRHKESVASTMPGELFATITTFDIGFARRTSVSASRTKQLPSPDTTESRTTRYRGGDLAVLVSAFWEIPKSKHNDNQQQQQNPYWSWFMHSLHISMPTIFFTDLQTIPKIAARRDGRPTLFVPFDHTLFQVSEEAYPSHWTHADHVPSAQLARIWLEKMHLVYLAHQLQPNATFYVWCDAGLSSLRVKDPVPLEWSTDVLSALPRDRVTYCAVSSEYHTTSSGLMLFPHGVVTTMHHLFYVAFARCARTTASWLCGSEQYLWTEVRKEYPNLFHAACYDYGDIAWLWGEARSLF